MRYLGRFVGRWRRRVIGLIGVVFLFVAGGATLVVNAGAPSTAHTGASPSGTGSHWDATWGASPQAATPLAAKPVGLSNQTVRNIVFTSIGGNRLRVRVSNRFGTTPLHLGRVTVGVELDAAELVDAVPVRSVTFGGHESVLVPAGREAVSDEMSMRVHPQEDLAVSLYLPAATGPATYHLAAWQTNYVASGDHTSDVGAAAYTETTASWYFLDGVDVRNVRARGSIVAFGDSITDVGHSQTNANTRWPNYLSRRLEAALRDRAPSVINEGISGNRVLNASPCYGASALTRFKRDVLSQSGVKDVILLEGINDIGFSQTPNTGCSVPNTSVSAQEIERGYLELIRQAHAHGLKILGGTLTPFKGSFYWSPAAEAKRDAVNNWIRTSHAFDGVIDFARATQDRYEPLHLNPAYNSGDDLHPNDAGCEAMANAISLALLK
jgi:lysophospholipase L1-like esterase